MKKRNMLEKYELDGKNRANLFTPHDCIIKEVKIENDFLVFIFEDDISYHDSIKYHKDNIKSLIIRYHLIDGFNVYKYNFKSLMKKEGYFLISNEKFLRMSGQRLEYLYEYVGFNSVVVELSNILLNVSSDYVIYEWLD